MFYLITMKVEYFHNIDEQKNATMLAQILTNPYPLTKDYYWRFRKMKITCST